MRGRFLRCHLERDDQVFQSSGFVVAGLTGKSSIRFEGQPRDHFELASKEIRAFQIEIFHTDVRMRIHTAGRKVKEDESYGKRKSGFQTSNELDMRDKLATTSYAENGNSLWTGFSKNSEIDHRVPYSENGRDYQTRFVERMSLLKLKHL